MKSCFFTGHRNVTVTEELLKRLKNEIIKLIENGVCDFYAGGAIGWDILCEKTVIELRKKYPEIKLHLLIPCPYEQQTEKWNDIQKKEYYAVLKSAGSIDVLSKSYNKTCMKERNIRLTESGDVCLCYYDPKRSRSGTAQTVRNAEKKNIIIINLFYTDP